MAPRLTLNTDELARTARSLFSPDGAAADKVHATLRGLGLPIPTAVATVADAARDLQAGDDDGAVLTALAVWDDLIAGRSTVAGLGALVDTHLGELRAAQEVASSSPAGLPEDLASQRTELRDLLDAGELVGKLGRISAITSAIAGHRATRLADLRAELRERVADEQTALRARYGSVDAGSMAETLSRLDQLVPDEKEEIAPDVAPGPTRGYPVDNGRCLPTRLTSSSPRIGSPRCRSAR